MLFYEYFHGDTGRGVGASHQTGWTGLVAKLLMPRYAGSQTRTARNTHRPQACTPHRRHNTSDGHAPVRYTHLPQPVMPKVPPQKLLLGQKALVTGASSGIGRAIALALG